MIILTYDLWETYLSVWSNETKLTYFNWYFYAFFRYIQNEKRSETESMFGHVTNFSLPDNQMSADMFCSCLICARNYRKILSDVCQLFVFSVWYLCVRVLSVSNLSAVRILPWLLKKCCPFSVCPSGQGRDIALQTFGVLVRRQSDLCFNSDRYCDLVWSGDPWLMNSLDIGEAFRMYFVNTVEPIIIK